MPDCVTEKEARRKRIRLMMKRAKNKIDLFQDHDPDVIEYQSRPLVERRRRVLALLDPALTSAVKTSALGDD